MLFRSPVKTLSMTKIIFHTLIIFYIIIIIKSEEINETTVNKTDNVCIGYCPGNPNDEDSNGSGNSAARCYEIKEIHDCDMIHTEFYATCINVTTVFKKSICIQRDHLLKCDGKWIMLDQLLFMNDQSLEKCGVLNVMQSASMVSACYRDDLVEKFYGLEFSIYPVFTPDDLNKIFKYFPKYIIKIISDIWYHLNN